MRPPVLFLIALFGAAGALARYGVSGAVYRLAGDRFAYGTLAVNVIGSFLLGFLVEFGLGSDRLSPEWRSALGIGFLGAFTTFSTFSYETVRYIQQGTWKLAALNVTTNVILCLFTCAAGVQLARRQLGG